MRKASALVLALGCDGSAHDRAPVLLNEVVLVDVQGLSGGQDVWGRAEGEAFAQVVRPGASGL